LQESGGRKMNRSVNEKAPWYVRLASVVVCNWINKTGIESFQCSGQKNWEYNDGKVDIQVPTYQIMHWVLRITGKQVAPVDVCRKYGIALDLKREA
jgi:hypothetical protein